MNIKLLILLLFAFVAALQDTGFSLNVEPITDFQVEKIIGVWYAIKVLTGNSFVSNIKCNRYDLKVEDSKFIMHLDGLTIDTGDPVYLESEVTTDNSHIANFTNHVTGMNSMIVDSVFQLCVLGTDYENYIVSYSCDYNQVQVYSWIASRQRHPPDSVLEEIKTILKERGITKTFEDVNQEDCPN